MFSQRERGMINMLRRTSHLFPRFYSGAFGNRSFSLFRSSSCPQRITSSASQSTFCGASKFFLHTSSLRTELPKCCTHPRSCCAVCPQSGSCVSPPCTWVQISATLNGTNTTLTTMWCQVCGAFKLPSSTMPSFLSK